MTASCPRCQQPLVRVREADAMEQRCATCGGVALTAVVVKNRTSPARFGGIWRRVLAAGGANGPACPSCRRPMHTMVLGPADLVATGAAVTDGSSMEIDLCRPCTLVWFDPGEQERLGAQSPIPPISPAPTEAMVEARLLMARERARLDAEEARRKEREISLVALVGELASDLLSFLR